jgi:hypothetical protein
MFLKGNCVIKLYNGGKVVDKKPLIGVSICAVVLLVLSSLTNVVGYQQVQSSNQKIINEKINQKELLFQTILDIANNKEIQRIILKSQISREGFFNPDVRFSIFNTPVLTKNQLKHMYTIGLMLSKTISKSRMHSMVERYQVNNQGMQKEIITVIEKDSTLNNEITQLSSLKCDCGNESTTRWRYPIICSILSIIFFGLGLNFVFFNIIISEGRLRNNPILVLMAVLIWLEVGSLWVTVDCLIDIYCETEPLVLSENTS